MQTRRLRSSICHLFSILLIKIGINYFNLAHSQKISIYKNCIVYHIALCVLIVAEIVIVIIIVLVIELRTGAKVLKYIVEVLTLVLILVQAMDHVLILSTCDQSTHILRVLYKYIRLLCKCLTNN